MIHTSYTFRFPSFSEREHRRCFQKEEPGERNEGGPSAKDSKPEKKTPTLPEPQTEKDEKKPEPPSPEQKPAIDELAPQDKKTPERIGEKEKINRVPPSDLTIDALFSLNHQFSGSPFNTDETKSLLKSAAKSGDPEGSLEAFVDTCQRKIRASTTLNRETKAKALQALGLWEKKKDFLVDIMNDANNKWKTVSPDEEIPIPIHENYDQVNYSYAIAYVRGYFFLKEMNMKTKRKTFYVLSNVNTNNGKDVTVVPKFYRLNDQTDPLKIKEKPSLLQEDQLKFNETLALRPMFFGRIHHGQPNTLYAHDGDSNIIYACNSSNIWSKIDKNGTGRWIRMNQQEYKTLIDKWCAMKGVEHIKPNVPGDAEAIKRMFNCFSFEEEDIYGLREYRKKRPRK